MPGGDQTGPAGQGRQTGRGAGYCGGNATPGYATAGQRQFGGGRRRGGQGRRFRNRQAQLAATQPGAIEPAVRTPSATRSTEGDEIATLKQQAAELSASLQEIQTRLVELEEGAGGDTSMDSADA